MNPRQKPYIEDVIVYTQWLVKNCLVWMYHKNITVIVTLVNRLILEGLYSCLCS